MSDKNLAIINALRGERWDYRTIDGISNETGISPVEVKDYLLHNKDKVWKSSLPDRKGNTLFTFIDRKPLDNDLWRSLSTFISKSST